MHLIIFKLIAFIVILFMGIGGGFLSLRLGTLKESERLFSLGNAFGGGIFLGAGLIHMLPDAHDELSQLGANYPFTFLICALGFLLILYLEKVLVHGHSAVTNSLTKKTKASIYPYILILVLSIHSIIAGIALGTESKVVLSIAIFIALISHKGSAAFALGVSLIRADIQKRRIKKILVFFSFATPIGIVLGAVLTAMLTGRTEAIVEGIFDAIAAGTFLYVAIVNILNKEFKQPRDIVLKFIMAIMGLVIMALIAIWA